MYMCICVCIWVQVLMKKRKECWTHQSWSSRQLWVIQCWCWKPNFGPLCHQHVLLKADPNLWSLFVHLKYRVLLNNPGWHLIGYVAHSGPRFIISWLILQVLRLRCATPCPASWNYRCVPLHLADFCFQSKILRQFLQVPVNSLCFGIC